MIEEGDTAMYDEDDEAGEGRVNVFLVAFTAGSLIWGSIGFYLGHLFW